MVYESEVKADYGDEILRSEAFKVIKLTGHLENLSKEEAQSKIQTLLAPYQLTTIQTNLTNLFTNWKDFFSQYHQLTNTEKKLQYTNYVQYISTSLATGGSMLGGYYSVQGGYLSGVTGFAGMAASYAVNKKLKNKLEEIKNRWGNTENVREQTIDNFIQATV